MGTKRFDVVRCGIRITRTSGTDDPVEFKVREKILDLLAQNSKVATLRAFQDGALKMHDLIQARDHGLLLNDQVLSELRLRQNLWTALEETFPKPKPGKRHTQAARYYASAAAFARKAGAALGPSATVQSLATFDWEALAAQWGQPTVVTVGTLPDGQPRQRTYTAGPSDWMHLRRMISAALTRITGSTHSPFRLAVMKTIPTMREVKRMPELDVTLFETIAALTPAHVRPAYYTLFITGMRRKEYLSCTRAHLNAESLTVTVPGAKTDEAAGVISVHADLWHWIEAGIPAPVREKWLWVHWDRARRAAKVMRRITVHDLRHGAASAASDAGAATAHIQALLRHMSPDMTRRYEARRSTRQAADAIGRAFTTTKRRTA